MKLYILLTLLILTSCGKASDNTNNNLPDKPLNNFSKSVLIIGGQSNAMGLISASEGIEKNSSIVTSIMTPNAQNIVGYAVGGTSINFWLKPLNVSPLLFLLKKYCSVDSVLVWSQGESDVSDVDGIQPEVLGSYLLYKERTETLFKQFKSICPSLRIIVVQIQYINAIEDTTIRNIQTTIGDYYITQDDIPRVDQWHSNLIGYNILLDKIFNLL